MFVHLFTYRLKTLLRDRALVFWTLAFPLILATLFHLAFANLGPTAHFSSIPVAVIDNQDFQEAQAFQMTLEAMAREQDALLQVTITDRETAETLLRNEDIVGYILAGREMELHVNNTGLRQSIVNIFLNQFSQISDAIDVIITEKQTRGENIEAGFINDFINHAENRANYLQNVPAGRNRPNALFILYFALLGMSCFYGAYFGLTEVMDIEADLSVRAARLNLSPQHKLGAFLSNSSASLLLHFCGQLVLLAYLQWGLNVSFAGQRFFIILTTLAGSFTGLTMGAFIGTLVKGNYDFKESVITGVTMVGAFLAGLMFPDVKYFIHNTLPPLAWLNPVNLLADSYYALYYFEDYTRYAQNIALLLIFALIFCSGTYLSIRRKKYASL